MYYVCGVAISSQQMHELQRILVRDRIAIETGAAFAVTAALVGEQRRVHLSPEMVDALAHAIDDAGGAGLDDVRAAVAREIVSQFVG
jgi:hypothetical protein